MIRNLIHALALVFAIAWSSPAVAQPADGAPLTFKSAAEESRFHALALQLRCVMCQNQSLADSNAQIAIELRKEVLSLMRQGKSDAQIKEFLVQRYGEFILYRPAANARNMALWVVPGLLVIGAFGALWFWQRRHPIDKRTESTVDQEQRDVEW